MRAGQYELQVGGYSAFLPADLPPEPPIAWDDELTQLLHDAALALGRLDMAASDLPKIDVFISIFVRQEAVLSSQIEGTQCTLEDVLRFEADDSATDKKKDDVQTVLNYIKALQHAINRLTDTVAPIPLCNRLLCEVQRELLQGLRGSERLLGQFRKTQNHIGSLGSSLHTASFVPPPPAMMLENMSALERFLHSKELPALILVALAHAQFETIHPFEDGNGRVGRLLITLFLWERKILRRPLLYLSHYFKANQLEYNAFLMAVRERGDWEGWIKFFLKGVIKVSEQALNNASAISNLRSKHIDLVKADKKAQALELTLLDYLFEQPIVTVQKVSDHLDCVYGTAAKFVDRFVELGILQETTGRKRNRRYEYAEYLNFWIKAQDDYHELKNSSVQLNQPSSFLPEDGHAAVQQVRRKILTFSEITESVFADVPSPWMKMIFSANGLQSEVEYLNFLQNHEVHVSNEEFLGAVLLEPGSYLSLRLTKMGQFVAGETYEIKKRNGAWFWQQAWTKNPLIKPLSSAELGIRIAQQLISIANRLTKFTGALVSHWVNGEKKLLVVCDDKRNCMGAKIASDPEIEFLLDSLKLKEHLPSLIGKNNYNAGFSAIILKDASIDILQSFQLFSPQTNQREFERAGKDWISDRFSALREVNAKRIDGEIYWHDVDSGSQFTFVVYGEHRMCFFHLQEIQQCVMNPALQLQLSERLNIEVQKLPSLFSVDGDYQLKFSSNQNLAGEGLVKLLNGQLSGHDTNYRWSGSYQLQDGVLQAKASVKKYKEGLDSIFGALDSFDITMLGPVLPNFLRLEGRVEGQPHLTIDVEMIRVQ